MVDEDFSFEQSPAEKVTTFFGTPIKDAVVEQPALPGPEAVDELAETPMAWKELCEGMLRELHTCVEKRKFFQDREAELKAELKKFVGLDRGMIQRGEFGVEVKEVNAAKKTDYTGFLVMLKAWAEEHMGKEGRADVEKMLANNTTEGGKTLKVTPYRVGSEPSSE